MSHCRKEKLRSRYYPCILLPYLAIAQFIGDPAAAEPRVLIVVDDATNRPIENIYLAQKAGTPTENGFWETQQTLEPGKYLYDPHEPPMLGQSSNDGKYTIEDTEATLFIAARGYLTRRLSASPGGADAKTVSIRLLPCSTITFDVRNLNSVPVSGATLHFGPAPEGTIMHRGRLSPMALMWDELGDRPGKLELYSPPQDYNMVTVSHENYAPAYVYIRQSGKLAESYTVTLHQGASISGKIRFSGHRRPSMVASARFETDRGERYYSVAQTCSDEGTFSLSRLPAGYAELRFFEINSPFPTIPVKRRIELRDNESLNLVVDY